MDFSKEIMDQQGHGTYSHVKLQKQLPKFFLAYVSDPSDSGKIHHNVFARWCLCTTQIIYFNRPDLSQFNELIFSPFPQTLNTSRWQSGDKEVCDAVKKFAQFTDEAL